MESLRTGTGLKVQGWHSRGYLPHFDGGEICQSVTLRLADSVPESVLNKWRALVQHLPEEEAKRLLRERIEKYTDQGYGKCFLRLHGVAMIVIDDLQKYDGTNYRLHTWVVMPNHIHLLFTPLEPHTLAEIMHSLKGYTATEANVLLNREGTFWQEDYFDRRIRDGNHFANAFDYVEFNPVKARLTRRPEDWKYGAAWYRTRAVKG